MREDVLMNFWIQVSNPKMLAAIDQEDETICDAMQTVFPMQTEDAFMVWNRIHIPIGYKYTLGFLLGEAIRMISELKQRVNGSHTTVWPSNVFHSTWHMHWQGDQLEIHSKWDSVVGFTEVLLAERSTLSTSRDAFIAEWKALFGVALTALTQAGYTETMLVDMQKLQETYDAIPNWGILYK